MLKKIEGEDKCNKGDYLIYWTRNSDMPGLLRFRGSPQSIKNDVPVKELKSFEAVIYLGVAAVGTGVVNAGEAVGSAAVSSVNAVGNSSLKKALCYLKKEV